MFNMGWVVYAKGDGEILRYYKSEKAAQSQVTGHNKKLFLDILHNGHSRYESRKEWAYCNWHDFEEVYKKYYEHNKHHMLVMSSFR